MSITEISEIAKNTSEAARNFQLIIDSILQPRGIDLAIVEGHKKLIEAYMIRDDIDGETKIAFLSSYKRMIKEHRNCKAVVDHAIPLISDNARPQDVEEDWFSFFFDKVRLISDETVQNMWSQILAKEVNIPGNFQRSLLHTLSIMSSSQAELFCNIARFCMYEYKNEDVIHPLLFVSSNAKSYKESRIEATQLIDLANLGLIQCDFNNEYIFPKKKVFRYGTKVIEVYGDPDNKDRIMAGNVIFTYNGKTLFGIVGEAYKQYSVDILNFTIAKFQKRNCKIIINGKSVE